MSSNQNRVVIALVLSAIAFAGVSAAGPNKRLREFRDLYAAARHLESAAMLHAESGDNLGLLKERNLWLFAFAREPKSEVVTKHYQQLTKLVSDYRLKAYQYAEESRKRIGNWFTKMVTFGGPLGALKGMSKNDDFLSGVSQRYESLEKSGTLTDSMIDKDMAQFQIHNLNMILFVLTTDVKYLVIENRQLLNSAIFRQLVADKFVANHNFYDIHELTRDQRKLLLDFYASRVDLTKVSVGEALEHYQSPSDLIIGRLLDSCQSVGYYRAEWAHLLPKCGEQCQPGNQFSRKNNPVRYEDVGNFCEELLESL